MPRRCQKRSCGRFLTKKSLSKFLPFPTSPADLVEKWIAFCQQPQRIQANADGYFVMAAWIPPSTKGSDAVLCSDHFCDDDFTNQLYKTLRPGAIPSIAGEDLKPRWKIHQTSQKIDTQVEAVSKLSPVPQWIHTSGPAVVTDHSATEAVTTDNIHVETSQHPCDSMDEDTMYCNVHVKREPVDEDTMEFATDQSSNNSNQSSNDNRSGQHEWPWIKNEQDTGVISCTVKSERLSESGDYDNDNGSQTLQLTCWDSSPESEANCESSIVKHSNAEIRNALAILRQTIHLNSLTECIVPLQTIETAFKKSIFQ